MSILVKRTKSGIVEFCTFVAIEREFIGKQSWSTDISRAQRFVRPQDAEQVVRGLNLSGRNSGDGYSYHTFNDEKICIES